MRLRLAVTFPPATVVNLYLSWLKNYDDNDDHNSGGKDGDDDVQPAKSHHDKFPQLTMVGIVDFSYTLSYILKVGLAGWKNPQMIWNFPQRYCLGMLKLRIKFALL